MDKKIAIFIPNLMLGGAEKMVVTLANKFIERGYIVEVLLAQVTGDYLSSLKNEVKVIDLKGERIIKALPSLIKYMKNSPPDVMISFIGYANVIALIAKLISGISFRMIVSERDDVVSLNKGVKGNFIKFLMRVLYPKSHKIIAISHKVKSGLNKVGINNNIEVIYNPINIEDIKDKEKEKINLDIEKPIVLYVGRLVEVKNLPFLIESFSLLRNKVDAKLIIIGKGPEKNKLEKLIKSSNLEEDIILKGFIKNPIPYMKIASVTVVSSISEGFCNALLEAMAVNCQVVSTNCGGPTEILENGKWGQIIEQGDSVVFSKALEKAIKREELFNVEERVNDFNLDKVVDHYLETLFLY